MEHKHFILVHGVCHGAWSWYKLKPLLQAAGHRVTLLDMAASGINSKTIQDVHSLAQYSEPLLQTMAALPPNEKVILVGHSFGGMSLAVAMEKYPEKIAASVFLTAFAPDTDHQPSYVLDKYFECTPMEVLLDTHFSPYENTAEPLTSIFFGPEFMTNNVYQLSPLEDLELAKTLVRTGSLFREELAKAEKFSEKKYGSVRKVYVICSEDKTIRKEFQQWMIGNYGIEDVMEIDGADHMPMFSKPLQLFQCLLQIARNYS